MPHSEHNTSNCQAQGVKVARSACKINVQLECQCCKKDKILCWFPTAKLKRQIQRSYRRKREFVNALPRSGLESPGKGLKVFVTNAIFLNLKIILFPTISINGIIIECKYVTTNSLTTKLCLALGELTHTVKILLKFWTWPWPSHIIRLY